MRPLFYCQEQKYKNSIEDQRMIDRNPDMQFFKVYKNKKNQPKQNIFQNQSNSQLHFAQTNPFYHIQKALKNPPLEEESSKIKFLQNMTVQIGEMKQICQKLMGNDIECNKQRQETLIMDLQNLQTKRTDIDDPEDQPIKSLVSINNFIEKPQKKCQKHKNCNKINSILQKASQKIEQLTVDYQNLKNQLQEQLLLKLKASDQNQKLRSQIAKLDEKKCSELQGLRRQLQKLKKNGYKKLENIQKVDRTSISNKIQQKVIEQKKEILQTSVKEILLNNDGINKKSYVNPKNTQIKLRNLVYL